MPETLTSYKHKLRFNNFQIVALIMLVSCVNAGYIGYVGGHEEHPIYAAPAVKVETDYYVSTKSVSIATTQWHIRWNLHPRLKAINQALTTQ